MNFGEFKLERYFAQYEFKVKYILSASDCESITLRQLLEMSDEQGLELWNSLSLGYTQSQGHPLLLEEISKLYPGIPESNVLVTVPEEGIFIALSSLLEKGDNIIVTDPAYQSLYEIPKALGCSVTKWPLILEGGQWQLDLDMLGKSINEKTKLIIINFPHNPTGFVPSRDELNRVVEIARRHGLYIFSDEMYRLSEYDDRHRLEAVGSFYERGVSLSGLSKSFGLPGLRVGWLAAKDKGIIEKFCTMKDYTTICSNGPGEILAIIALRAKEKILQRNLSIIKNNLKIAEAFFKAYSKIFCWISPKAGPIAFADLRLEKPVKDFCMDVVERKNLMILPSDVFEYEGNYFRVGLGRRNFETALGKLGEYVKENL